MNSDGFDDVINYDNDIIKNCLSHDISKYESHADYLAKSAYDIWTKNITTIHDSRNGKKYENCQPYKSPDDISIIFGFSNINNQFL